MPYIKQEDRDIIEPLIAPLLANLKAFGLGVRSYGNLNYIITRILTDDRPLSYTEINGLIGVLECAKLELYRRVAVPYENMKAVENGEVY